MEQLKAEYNILQKEYALIPNIVDFLKLDKYQLAFYLKKIHRHKNKAKQEYPSNDREAFISLGRNVFPESILQKHSAQPPIDMKWGKVKIWEQPMDGFKYTMGIDTSEGLGKDNGVIQVLNAHTGFQAAELADNEIDAAELAKYALMLGHYYNEAFMVPEINSSGITFLDNVKKVYYNIYRREGLDKRSDKAKKTLGWRTTGTSKPLLVETLISYLDDRDVQVNSRETLNELKTFVRTEEQGKNGYGSEGSNKDDRVIALGLATMGIREIPYMRTPKSLAQQKQDEYIKAKDSYLPQQSVYIKNNKPRYGLRKNNGVKKY